MARERERTHAPGDVTIEHDAVSEGILIAAALTDDDARATILRAVEPDHLFEPRHRDAIAAMKELARRHLHFDLATLQQVGDVDPDYLAELARVHPDAPVNIAFHVERVLWDAMRLNSARGPVQALVQALKDPLEDPSRVRALARQVGGSLDGFRESKYLRDPDELVHEMMAELAVMRDGLQSYSYGIDRLDYYEYRPEIDSDLVPTRRMVPGAMPGQITCITGLSGVGKSTVTARIALGLARNRRRVLYGAWEQRGNVTLRIIACMSLGIERSRLSKKPEHGGLTDEEMVKLRDRARHVARRIRFLDNPFNRKVGEKRGNDRNDRNLDVLQACIADSGCDVFIGDLWERCLREPKPEDVSLALIRQQAMAEELKVHCILVQQQRLKDIEQRADKRPTRDGIKGSGAWVEVSDTIIGVHRPALFKQIEDNVLELDILKQRYGIWPMAIEFEWDPDTGLIAGGKTVAYDSYDDDGGSMDDWFKKGGDGDKKKRRGR